MTIYLVRHGEKMPGVGDPPLSPNGRAQATKLARYFQSIGVDAIYSSPYKRTVETSQIIADNLGISFSLSPLLKERANWGDMKAISFPEFLEIWDKASNERDWQPPIGDSSRAAGERLNALINNVFNPNLKHIAIVTHGGIISDYLRNIAREEMLYRICPDFSKKRDRFITECSLTILEKNDLNSPPVIKSIATTKYPA